MRWLAGEGVRGRDRIGGDIDKEIRGPITGNGDTANGRNLFEQAKHVFPRQLRPAVLPWRADRPRAKAAHYRSVGGSQQAGCRLLSGGVARIHCAATAHAVGIFRCEERKRRLHTRERMAGRSDPTNRLFIDRPIVHEARRGAMGASRVRSDPSRARAASCALRSPPAHTAAARSVKIADRRTPGRREPGPS